MRAFLLLFLLFPVLELYVFFKVSTAIGFFPALLLIIAGSMLGVLVVRVAGLATALKARESLNRGELPAQQMLEGQDFKVVIKSVVKYICLCFWRGRSMEATEPIKYGNLQRTMHRV